MNDPRGVLEEFVGACAGFRDRRGQRFDVTVDANLDPESRRMAYRQKHEDQGVCRSCKVKAKPGRKYCEKHLAEASKRVKAGSMAMRERVERLERDLAAVRSQLAGICINAGWASTSAKNKEDRT